MRFLGGKRRKKVLVVTNVMESVASLLRRKAERKGWQWMEWVRREYCSVSGRRETPHVSDDGTVANMGHPAFGLACFGTYDFVCPPGFVGPVRGMRLPGKRWAVANMGHLRKKKIYCDAKTKNQWLRASGSRETAKVG
jgi:hypothetical protein